LAATTTTDKDRKKLLRTLLDEVAVGVRRDHDEGRADLLLRWKGGAISELSVPLNRNRRSGCASARTPSTCCASWPCLDLLAHGNERTARSSSTAW
jgi:hypothetical protein